MSDFPKINFPPLFICGIKTPPEIPILMSLLYHNDTIIKKEKELLRALLIQFCKLEFTAVLKRCCADTIELRIE